MKEVCAGPNTVSGIDIFHSDPITDILAVKAAGIEFVLLKASEYSEDPRFATRWPAMKEAGLLRGAYDFFHPNRDPVNQANAFLKIVGPLDVEDIPLILDWETANGTPANDDKDSALLWLNRVEQISGKVPIIYGSSYFLNELGLGEEFKKYGLWIAEYGVECPKVPSPWDTWDFWQNSESSVVPGISGRCDTDLYNGSLDQLKLFIDNSIVKECV